MEDSNARRFRLLSHRRLLSWSSLLLLVGVVLFWQFAPYVKDLSVPQDSTMMCTAIGCSNQVSLTVRFPDRRWPSGAHEVEVGLPDATIHCQFFWPTEDPVGVKVSALCAPTREEAPVRVEMEPEMSSDLTEGQWQIVPQHFLERITIAGTPTQVQVLQKVNGVVIGEKSFTFTYTEHRPNGPLCGPLCQQGSAEWELRSLTAVSAR